MCKFRFVISIVYLLFQTYNNWFGNGIQVFGLGLITFGLALVLHLYFMTYAWQSWDSKFAMNTFVLGSELMGFIRNIFIWDWQWNQPVKQSHKNSFALIRSIDDWKWRWRWWNFSLLYFPNLLRVWGTLLFFQTYTE